MNKYHTIIKAKISSYNLEDTKKIIHQWILDSQSKYVCVCNTHSLVTSYKNTDFNLALQNANLSIPDGMPLVWALKLYGVKDAERVDGPNLMQHLLMEGAKNKQYKIFLYGNTEECISDLKSVINTQYKGVQVVGSYSPPFRELEKREKQDVIDSINSTDANLVFVSLGCPKQELWMYEMSGKIDATMIGVGAAFDFLTNRIKRPPLFFQKIGMEWFFRLLSEPRRLWKRYFYNNSMFLFLFFKTFLKNKDKGLNNEI
ncbi:WecB/TagA/CpsF family glycosyltransferase [Priestia megaterium]|uniref:WecB/TagA/CpsF family glycosyltransferase n=1 Tax=Priestia megaterium TaxID=1404 RepID=UPI000BFBF17D|nr:WecB/TagA/CpsF family glycosyltransferase [Priestia megaterium]PGK31199.1 glycosyltransferase [Priestia megaterium]